MVKLGPMEIGKGANPFDELKKLEKEVAALEEKRVALLDQAKAGAKAKIEAAIDEANSMGFNFWLGEGKRSGKTASATKSSRGSMAADKECPICKFTTSPAHDARKHRSQGANKKPFTAEELTAMGMTKVG